jgi:serine/threonine-protein kinase HipA
MVTLMTSKVYVFVQQSLDEKPVLAGRLTFSDNGVVFDYATSWLSNENAFALHPTLLPLSKGSFSEAVLEGALSVFRDSGPGIWGKEVIKRLHGQVGVDEQLVLSNNLLRIGVFRYSKDPKDGFSDSASNDDMSLEEMFDAINAFASGVELNERQKRLLEQGSSMDGMQPKDFFDIDRVRCIVKFPYKNNMDDKAANEFVGMLLAKECGIETPNISLIQLKEKHAFAVQRFDVDGSRVFPLMSAASAMGFRDKDDYKKSYIELAKTIVTMSSNPQQDCLSLFKRMVLNVMISNKDDHIYNHAFVKKESGWQLSPVYDVVCGEGMKREHSMAIGAFGRIGSLANALTGCEFFGLSDQDAKTIIDDMIDIVSNWKSLAINNGLSEQQIKGIDWAILHKDIFSGYKKE